MAFMRKTVSAGVGFILPMLVLPSLFSCKEPIRNVESHVQPLFFSAERNTDQPLMGPSFAPADSPRIGTGGLVVWSEEGRYPHTQQNIYASRIETPGFPIDSGGIHLAKTTGYQISPTVDGTVFGQSLVVWEDGSQIFGIRLSTDTGVVLDNMPLTISDPGKGAHNPAVITNGKNFLVGWAEGLGDEDIYGRRIDVNGTMLESQPFAIAAAAMTQTRPAFVYTSGNPMFDESYVVVWEDSRNGGGQIYGTGIDPTTGVIEHPNGVALVTTGFALQPSIAFDGSGLLLGWNGNDDILATRLTLDWKTQGPLSFIVSKGAQSESEPRVVGGGPLNIFAMAWRDERDGAARIYGTRISQQGAVLDPAGVAISPAGIEASHADLNLLDPGNSPEWGVVWQAGEKIQSATFDAQGQVKNGGVAEDVNVTGNRQISPSIAFDGQNYLAVWVDYRNHETTGADIYGARFEAKTGNQLDPNGIAICTAAGDQENPKVAFGPSGFYVVWDDERDGDGLDDIYGTTVSVLGVAANAQGIQISNANRPQITPSIGFDGSNFVVVWEEWFDASAEAAPFQIAARQIDSSGKVLGNNDIRVDTATSTGFSPVLVEGDNQVLIAWLSGSGTKHTLYASRMDQAGNLLDTAGNGLQVSDVTFGNPLLAQAGPTIRGAFGKGAYLLAWDNRASGGKTQLESRLVGADGLLAGSSSTVVGSFGSGEESSPQVAFNGDHFVIIQAKPMTSSPQSSNPPSDYQLVGYLLRADGTLLPGSELSFADSVSPAHADADQVALARTGEGQLSAAYVKFISTELGIERVFLTSIQWTQLGATCGQDSECRSGFCVSSICCNERCSTGQCTSGTCVSLPDLGVDASQITDANETLADGYTGDDNGSSGGLDSNGTSFFDSSPGDGPPPTKDTDGRCGCQTGQPASPAEGLGLAFILLVFLRRRFGKRRRSLR